MTDSEIIRLYDSGKKEEAFTQIVRNYSERLYWHIRRFILDHDEVDDLLQEVFIKVWAALPSFRGEARLFTWIYRIATNEALNYLRKERLRSALTFVPLDKIADSKIDEDKFFDGNKLQRELAKAIGKLPPKQRAVFTLRYYEEMPYEDISQILDSSVGSLKASYHHAYVKIKDYLEKNI